MRVYNDASNTSETAQENVTDLGDDDTFRISVIFVIDLSNGFCHLLFPNLR